MNILNQDDELSQWSHVHVRASVHPNVWPTLKVLELKNLEEKLYIKDHKAKNSVKSIDFFFDYCQYESKIVHKNLKAYL